MKGVKYTIGVESVDVEDFDSLEDAVEQIFSWRESDFIDEAASASEYVSSPYADSQSDMAFFIGIYNGFIAPRLDAISINDACISKIVDAYKESLKTWLDELPEDHQDRKKAEQVSESVLDDLESWASEKAEEIGKGYFIECSDESGERIGWVGNHDLEGSVGSQASLLDYLRNIWHQQRPEGVNA